MKKNLTLCLAFFNICILSAQTNVSGNQSGTWTKANSPYVLTATITVPTGQTLTIEPGVTVQFPYNNAQFIIMGTLVAKGDIADSIYFTGGVLEQAIAGPISFTATSNNSILQYLKITGLGYYYVSNTNEAILIQSNSCQILNCTIENIRGTAIQVDNTSPSLQNNVITSNAYFDIITGLDKIRYVTDNNQSTTGLTIGLLGYTMTSNDELPATNVQFYTLLATQTIPVNNQLIIEPGVTLQFPYNNAQLIVNGTLTAIGTASNYIYFTGGALGQATAGPINITSTSYNSTLQYVNISGLGYYYVNNTSEGILIQSSSCKILNCSIQNIRGSAIQIDNASPTINNNIITNNLYLDVLAGFDKIKYVTDNNETTNGLKIGLLNYNMGSSDTLTTTNIQYYYLLQTLTVPPTKTLVVEPGVTIQFPYNNSQLIINGTIKAEGTASNYIYFAGQSVGQATAGPISINDTTTHSLLQYIDIKGLGYYYKSATTATLILNSSCTVDNCTLENTNGVALEITGAKPVIVGDCLYNNYAGILSSGGDPSISQCNFINNGLFGLNNSNSADTVTATNCYWGDPSGPNEQVGNPGGQGDIIIGNVIYHPFSTEQFICSQNILLPVAILNFKATYSSIKSISCTWQTATESNSNYFTIQRSINGISFTDIAKVNAAGNSNIIRSYSYPDNTFNEAGVSKLYYRLQEVDKDGKSNYSNIVSVNLENENKMFVYPVPANNTLHISLTKPLSQNATVILYDINGKVALQQKAIINSINQQLNISALAEGNYNLVIIDNGKKISNSQIVIMR
jgi:hypothetical protein